MTWVERVECGDDSGENGVVDWDPRVWRLGPCRLGLGCWIQMMRAMTTSGTLCGCVVLETRGGDGEWSDGIEAGSRCRRYDRRRGNERRGDGPDGWDASRSVWNS
jgi:hypothetical protein